MKLCLGCLCVVLDSDVADVDLGCDMLLRRRLPSIVVIVHMYLRLVVMIAILLAISAHMIILIDGHSNCLLNLHI